MHVAGSLGSLLLQVVSGFELLAAADCMVKTPQGLPSHNLSRFF
jgi:hypothetical protein